MTHFNRGTFHRGTFLTGRVSEDRSNRMQPARSSQQHEWTRPEPLLGPIDGPFRLKNRTDGSLYRLPLKAILPGSKTAALICSIHLGWKKINNVLLLKLMYSLFIDSLVYENPLKKCFSLFPGQILICD